MIIFSVICSVSKSCIAHVALKEVKLQEENTALKKKLLQTFFKKLVRVRNLESE